ncbi:Re/Si-specific NAD(P)(+) transhydrogenase subunit alpha [Janthinobacterium sp. B9-8]|uniref:Re/Si-specific NAD(P)(+) transhydrogenase subunit alpha n=1 Tax=Janthinobacterium sp. B9-8 TaxID=1236179 RepID=UPI00061D2BEE|nr:Re/Si-specific NAD(P)(+) transhydrogenase subunit alpha [Janthinobacterium sp. B9-8]AMC34890.1 NADP transhydrogenase subunit alpha [Janthinobacterium sp. B9-8]
MLIAIPAEAYPGEFRVAATPETIKKLIKAGHTVRVESKAGLHAAISDAAYTEAGAEIASNPEALYQGAQLILKVRAPQMHELPLLPDHAALIALFDIHRYAHLDALSSKHISAYALELVPRITRAQSMDVLSSQANIAGYRAVLLATQYYPRFMPMLMTAAGTVKPARVLILGAGVAGLQAIATAKRLGAIVEVFDVRPATREQVESLGGKFIEVPLNDAEKAAAETAGGYAREMSEDYKLRQSALIDQQARLADIIISTAQIPGKAAPVLIPANTVLGMKAGSVIIDLAVDSGGNCPLSKGGEVVHSENGVIIVGHGNLASLLAADASALYARNMLTFLSLLQDAEGAYAPHFDDEIIKATLISHQGEPLFGQAPTPAHNVTQAQAA